MNERAITVPLDPETARAYESAPIEQRRKIEALVRLWVWELTSNRDQSLQEILDGVGAKARARGITPDILESLLKGA